MKPSKSISRPGTHTNALSPLHHLQALGNAPNHHSTKQLHPVQQHSSQAQVRTTDTRGFFLIINKHPSDSICLLSFEPLENSFSSLPLQLSMSRKLLKKAPWFFAWPAAFGSGIWGKKSRSNGTYDTGRKVGNGDFYKWVNEGPERIAPAEPENSTGETEGSCQRRHRALTPRWLHRELRRDGSACPCGSGWRAGSSESSLPPATPQRHLLAIILPCVRSASMGLMSRPIN